LSGRGRSLGHHAPDAHPQQRGKGVRGEAKASVQHSSSSLFPILSHTASQKRPRRRPEVSMSSVKELHATPGVCAAPEEATRGYIFQQVRAAAGGGRRRRVTTGDRVPHAPDKQQAASSKRIMTQRESCRTQLLTLAPAHGPTPSPTHEPPKQPNKPTKNKRRCCASATRRRRSTSTRACWA
jgi:hypothetical protein